MFIFESKYSGTFLVAAGVSHALNYRFLNNFTLISSYWTWLFLGIPTLVGLLFLVRTFELHKDDTYQLVKGIKLQLTKMLIILMMGGYSFTVFGGYLNTLALGTNYLFRGQEI